MTTGTVRRAIIGVGNEYRGDDAAGILAARRLHALRSSGIDVFEHSGEGTSLLSLMQEYNEVILIDAICSGALAGTVHYIDGTSQQLPRQFRHASSHAVGVAEAIELGRTFGTLPAVLLVIGVEGSDYETGKSCSPAVAAGIEELASRIQSTDFRQLLQRAETRHDHHPGDLAERLAHA